MSATSAVLLRACSVLLCLVAGSLQLSIKEFVVPKAIELGNDAELRCQYELGPDEPEAALYVKWWWKLNSSPTDERKLIYQRIAGLAAETLHRSNSSKIDIKDNDTIVLVGVAPVDSGTYECEVSNINEKRQHGDLVVYHMGTGPLLNISEVTESTEDGAEKSSLLIECQAEDVAPKPILGVTIDGQSVNITTKEEEQDGLYTVYANVTVSTEGMGESEIRCEMFYSNDNISHPPYVDTKTFEPQGYDMQSTTEMPEDTTEPEATPESLQNSRDDGRRLHSSWILLIIAVVFTHLRDIL